MEAILNSYYKNNAQKLHEMVNKILLKFGGLCDKDMDDFYSLANEVFLEVMDKYDGKQSFDVFLFYCLSNKIKTEITRRNREKRRADRMCISIDTPVGDEEDSTLGDMLVDSFNMDKEIFGEDDVKSSKIKRYLERLSKRQRNVVELLAASYKAGEIQELLHITQKEYSDAVNGIYAYENISILF